MSENLFSNDTEVSLLSILVNTPNLIYKLTALRPYMLSAVPHQLILETMLELISQNLVPDVNLLVTKLESTEKLDKAGGRDYIKYLISQNVPYENLPEFEKILTNSYKAKRLMSMSAEISGASLQTSNVDEVITSFRERLDSLSIVGGGEKTFSLGSAVYDVWKGIVSRVENPGLAGKTFGLEQVDLSTGGISKGDYWVIASRPSMGKTAIACNSIIQTAKAGNNVLLFSREMSKGPTVERLIAIEAKVPIFDLRVGNLNQDALDRTSQAITRLKDLPIHIDTSFTTSTAYVEGTIRKYVKTYNTDLVFVDYLQLLSERGDDATQELGRISRLFKLLAVDLEIGIVVLSQLNREVEKRDDRRPIMSDLRQCGNIEEDADVVIGLYRDEVYNKSTPDKGILEFIMRKQRNGPVGTLRLKIDLPTNVISD